MTIETLEIEKIVYQVKLADGSIRQRILPEMTEGYYSIYVGFLPEPVNPSHVVVEVNRTIGGLLNATPYITETYLFKGNYLPYEPNGFDSAYFTNTGIPALKISDINGTIALIETPTDYVINCDGCGVGECKGNKARYPGYDCLDCAKLQRQLKSMGAKIDGVTKR
ncbi:hypothetical protein [Cylindrospermum sp. FACHB-282]|uniref:hypothetical protein n=1 Tax=Cylindrospermum sp. FACHB-282 TaxID=2692794 RepID=UPI0016832F4D|nr:hypothetical protein [Cylindrospermum sp. FACHB-282]MBD2388847.1 hypothetical protein [Cylindrospermum sp. FACHB-282]